MVYLREITTDHLNENIEMGLPFQYNGVAQFIPISNTKFRFVILKKGTDDTWDSFNKDLDYMDEDFLETIGFELGDCAFEASIKNHLRDYLYDSFQSLFDKYDPICMKKVNEVEKIVYNFSNTLKELDEWLQNHKYCDYVKFKYQFTSKEKVLLSKILSYVPEQEFDSLEKKKHFWEDILILHNDYFPDKPSSELKIMIKKLEEEIEYLTVF